MIRELERDEQMIADVFIRWLSIYHSRSSDDAAESIWISGNNEFCGRLVGN